VRKGNLVKLNPATCFTVKNGGMREFPLEHSANDRAQIVNGHRHLTEDEVAEWRDSSVSRGLDGSGESKLPPTCMLIAIHKDVTLIVERARCRMSFSYYSPTGGWTKVLNPINGESLYVKRELLEVISLHTPQHVSNVSDVSNVSPVVEKQSDVSNVSLAAYNSREEKRETRDSPTKTHTPPVEEPLLYPRRHQIGGPF
jgi:hypothetical protein